MFRALKTIGLAWLIAAVSLCAASRAAAELVWAQKTVDLKATAETPVAEARFRFTNKGPEAVEIRQVQTSCGCTTAALSQRRFNAGESGEIVASYHVGNRVGMQKASLQVLTDGTQDPVILNLNVDIPEVLRIQPAFVRWSHGEALATKSMTLEMMQDTPIKEITVQSSSSSAVTELKALVPGRKYQLNVVPAQTAQYLFATLTIRCQFGKEEKIFRAYATVSPPAPSDDGKDK